MSDTTIRRPLPNLGRSTVDCSATVVFVDHHPKRFQPTVSSDTLTATHGAAHLPRCNGRQRSDPSRAFSAPLRRHGTLPTAADRCQHGRSRLPSSKNETFFDYFLIAAALRNSRTTSNTDRLDAAAPGGAVVPPIRPLRAPRKDEKAVISEPRFRLGLRIQTRSRHQPA